MALLTSEKEPIMTTTDWSIMVLGNTVVMLAVFVLA